MTDPRTPDVTDEDRKIARDWAWQVKADPDAWTDRLRAAARVILHDDPAPTPPTTTKGTPDMPDQTLDDQVRPIVDAMRAAMRRDEHTYSYGEFLGDMSDYIKALEALLPPRPTLAGMTPEERAGCRWMQADVSGRDTRYVIATPHDRHGDVALIDADGKIDWTLPEYVTPRPDLPRMTWPGEQQPAPAPALPEGWRLADHLEYGRVIVTRPAPDRNGNVPFMLPDDDSPLRRTWHFCFPDELTYLDQGADQ